MEKTIKVSSEKLGVPQRTVIDNETIDTVGQDNSPADEKHEKVISPRIGTPLMMSGKDYDVECPTQDLETLTVPDFESPGSIIKPADHEPLNLAEPLEIEPTPRRDDQDADMEALLGNVTMGRSSSVKLKRKTNMSICCARKQIGNVIILCQGVHSRTGYGVVGPHYYGPGLVLLIVALASHHFIHKASLLGPISTCTCIFFMLGTLYYLVATSFKDPGIVLGRPPESDLSDFRWCDFCNVYQPPDGAHCPDCNVCIAGYDHHCIWMGLCIGKGNIKAFVRFNLFWVLYLFYSVFWVSMLGPFVIRHFSS